MQVGQEVVKCIKKLYVEVKPDRIFIEGLYPHHILLKLEWDNGASYSHSICRGEAHKIIV